MDFRNSGAKLDVSFRISAIFWTTADLPRLQQPTGPITFAHPFTCKALKVAFQRTQDSDLL